MAIRHKIPASQKDRAWRIDWLKNGATRSMSNYYAKKDLYLLQASAGKLNTTEYKYVTNPMNLKDPKYQKYPAKLLNWDIISPLYRRLATQYTERINQPEVYTRNSNFNSVVSEVEMGMINENLQQDFINRLIQSGKFDPMMAEKQQVEPPISPDTIKQKKTSIKDLVTQEGQHVLNYVIDEQMLPMKYRAAFDNFVKVNKYITFKDVRQDGIVVNNVETTDVEYFGYKNVSYLEDAEMIRVKYSYTFEEAMEIFQDMFELPEYKKEYGDISKILETQRQATNNRGTGELAMTDFISTYSDNRGLDWSKGKENSNFDGTIVCNVVHVQGTSFKKVGKVYDVENDKTIIVEEDYLGDDVYEWTWHPEEREGWVIDDKYYIGGYPCDIQIVDPDNPFSTKKNYNGRIFMQGGVDQLTTTETLMQYQEAYNVIKWKMQMTINKNKDKLLILPIGLLGHMAGTKTEGRTYYNGDLDDEGNLAGQFQPSINNGQQVDSAIAASLYYADATQMLFVDETSENAQLAMQMIKEIDLSLGNYIEYLMKYAASIKSEAEEYIGFNRFMMAKTTTNDAVGNVQQGIYSGSMVIEPYFIEFEEALAKEYQGILDRGRYAFRTGFKADYIRSNSDRQTLQVTENFPNHIYGCFVRSGAKSKELLDLAKNHANELLQNGLSDSPSVAFKLFSNTLNHSEIIQTLEEAEDLMMQRKQASEQAQNDAVVEAQQIIAETAAKELAFKYYKADLDAQIKIMDSAMETQSFITSAGETEGLSEINNTIVKSMAEINKLRLGYANLKGQLQMNALDNRTKKEVSQDNVTIAKSNKN